MSLLNPRQFFSRKPLPVYTLHPRPESSPVQASYDVRSDEQKAADQARFDSQGLPSRLPRHRA